MIDRWIIFGILAWLVVAPMAAAAAGGEAAAMAIAQPPPVGSDAYFWAQLERALNSMLQPEPEPIRMVNVDVDYIRAIVGDWVDGLVPAETARWLPPLAEQPSPGQAFNPRKSADDWIAEWENRIPIDQIRGYRSEMRQRNLAKCSNTALGKEESLSMTKEWLTTLRIKDLTGIKGRYLCEEAVVDDNRDNRYLDLQIPDRS